MHRNIDQKRNEELRAIEDPVLAQLYISVIMTNLSSSNDQHDNIYKRGISRPQKSTKRNIVRFQWSDCQGTTQMKLQPGSHLGPPTTHPNNDITIISFT